MHIDFHVNSVTGDDICKHFLNNCTSGRPTHLFHMNEHSLMVATIFPEFHANSSKYKYALATVTITEEQFIAK